MAQADHPLALCLKLLQGFGDAGRHVWDLGKLYVARKKEPLTEVERLIFLRDAIGSLRARAKEGNKWRTLPVNFRTFVESPALLNKNGVLWPEVIRCGEEINSGKYTECVLTGAIGCGKSTLAIYSQAYQIYVLSCMRSPHEVFDLDPSSEILTVFQSINKNLAQDVEYRRMRDMVEGSPYFCDVFPFDRNRESDLRFPRNIVVKAITGHDQAAIGQNVISGILDEVNYMAVVEKSKMMVDKGVYDQAKQNYNAIASRRESRFLQMGELPGMLCLVSSRNYPGQFTDQKEEEAKRNPRIYVYDKRLWELRPDRYSKETFRVFVGDATRKPRIMASGETVAARDDERVKPVPVDFRPRFEADILVALREVLGVATQAIYPFMMDVDKIAACFGKTPAIISRPDCDFTDTQVLLYPNRVRDKQHPRFAHLDLAMTRDSAGVAVGYVPGFVKVPRGDSRFEIMPVIRYDLLLAVRPPRGGEIVFSKVRQLLYQLQDVGIVLKWVTADQTMMSKDTLQIMSQKGYTVGYCSTDMDTVPYDFLKQAIYDGRAEAPEHALARTELTRLEVDPKTQKIDHPSMVGCSKDVSDAMACVCHGLTMRAQIWAMHGVSTRDIPKLLTQPTKKAQSYAEVRAEDRKGRFATTQEERDALRVLVKS